MKAPAEFDVFDCDLDGINLIEASAGTGKTWNICGLYLRLLLERGLDVQKILVVTFTNAATAELRERVRSRIVETLGYLRDGSQANPPHDPFVAAPRGIGRAAYRGNARSTRADPRQGIAVLRRSSNLHDPRLLPARPCGHVVQLRAALLARASHGRQRDGHGSGAGFLAQARRRRQLPGGARGLPAGGRGHARQVRKAAGPQSRQTAGETPVACGHRQGLGD